MTGVVGRPRAGTPDKVGGRYVVSRNDGTQQQDLWFVADTLEELRQGGRLLLDPNTFSEDGTSSLAGYNASKDGRWLAYLVSDGGSDWSSDPAARPRRRPRGRRRRHQGEVQRGDLAAGPLVLPLPALPDRGRRRRHRGGRAAGRPAAPAPRRRAPGRRRAGPGVPREPAAEHQPEALARRPLAGGPHPRGHLGEEPAVVLPGADRRRRQPSSASRSRSSTRRSPASTWCASTATRSTCAPTTRRRWAGWCGSTSRRSRTPAARTSSTSSPRATRRCERRARRRRRAARRAPGRRTAPADALRPRRHRARRRRRGRRRGGRAERRGRRRRGLPRPVVGDAAATTAYRLDLASGDGRGGHRPRAGRRHRRGRRPRWSPNGAGRPAPTAPRCRTSWSAAPTCRSTSRARPCSTATAGSTSPSSRRYRPDRSPAGSRPAACW